MKTNPEELVKRLERPLKPIVSNRQFEMPLVKHPKPALVKQVVRRKNGEVIAVAYVTKNVG